MRSHVFLSGNSAFLFGWQTRSDQGNGLLLEITWHKGITARTQLHSSCSTIWMIQSLHKTFWFSSADLGLLSQYYSLLLVLLVVLALTVRARVVCSACAVRLRALISSLCCLFMESGSIPGSNFVFVDTDCLYDGDHRTGKHARTLKKGTHTCALSLSLLSLFSLLSVSLSFLSLFLLSFSLSLSALSFVASFTSLFHHVFCSQPYLYVSF